MRLNSDMNDVAPEVQQSFGLFRVAGVDFMRDGQTLSGLHQKQHELTLNQSRLGHPGGAYVLLQIRLAADR